jgi:hypothetical protein
VPGYGVGVVFLEDYFGGLGSEVSGCLEELRLGGEPVVGDRAGKGYAPR